MLEKAAAVGRYVVSVPERVFGIREGIEYFKMEQADNPPLNPEKLTDKLSRFYKLGIMSMGGAGLEFLMPSMTEMVNEYNFPHRPKDTPFSRLISEGPGEAISGLASTLTDFAVDGAAYWMIIHGNADQAIALKLTANTASHVLVDAIKAGVTNFPHFRSSPKALSM